MRNYPFAAIVLLALVLSPLLSSSIYHYSTWQMDEQVPVVRALGFLDFDLNPRWFGYHTLPMYLLSVMYAAIYWFYWVMGWVNSKLEFASLLYHKDAVFFISGRLLCGFCYVLGIAVISRMFYVNYKSAVGCVLLFLMLLLLPDAHTAMNYIRVDTFVFLFMVLMVYFSIFHRKTFTSYFLSIVFCGAAIASKIPAVVFAAVLFISVAWDVKRRVYPKYYLLLFPAIMLISIFCFMPFAFIHFQDYWQSLLDVVKISGSVHFGKEHQFGLVGKVINFITTLTNDLGAIGLVAVFSYCVWAVIRKKNVFPIAYACSYGAVFITSVRVDEYWLRPVYPFFLLFAFSLMYEINFPAWIARIGNNSFVTRLNFLKSEVISASILPVLFVVIFFAQNIDVAYAMDKELAEKREETRVISAKWIYEHLPPESIVYMHGTLTYYLPKLLSKNPGDVLAVTDLNFANAVIENEYLTKAFFYYISTEVNLGASPTFQTIFLGPIGIEKARKLRKGCYVVMSSFSTQRYFDSDIERLPEADRPHLLSEKSAIELLRSQTLIAEFEGRGPRIEIYQIQ